MISVGIPLFRSKYTAARREAQLMRESIEFQQEERINELITNYEMTSFDIDQQSDLTSLYEEQIAEVQQVLNLLLTTYSNSGQEFEEVLRIQQQLLNYKKMKATALMNYHIAVAQLNYLTAKKY